jgi:uncharacterized protein
LKPHAAFACNLDAQVLSAAYPLLENGRVDAIEWSFDTLYQLQEIPEWFHQLLQTFSAAGRLTGHGVFFSLFSGKFTSEQQQWLKALSGTCEAFHFDHITEHFGFMTGMDFHKGAPISIPFTPKTLAIGQDRLKRLQCACQCAVGLENLAFSYTLDEVKKHGEFLHQLVMPVNGFIILDLHNLYCQLHNFDLPFEEIIGAYPLQQVREIHISGGSWAQILSPLKKLVRRDTHDGRVPEAVFELLRKTIPLCPNLKYVVLEQMGIALTTAETKLGFQQDFLRMQEIIAQTAASEKKLINAFQPPAIVLSEDVPEDALLHQQQMELSVILENCASLSEAREKLSKSSLAASPWQIENWQPYMLSTAMQIAQKWKNGWE